MKKQITHRRWWFRRFPPRLRKNEPGGGGPVGGGGWGGVWGGRGCGAGGGGGSFRGLKISLGRFNFSVCRAGKNARLTKTPPDTGQRTRPREAHGAYAKQIIIARQLDGGHATQNASEAPPVECRSRRRITRTRRVAIFDFNGNVHEAPASMELGPSLHHRGRALDHSRPRCGFF